MKEVRQNTRVTQTWTKLTKANQARNYKSEQYQLNVEMTVHEQYIKKNYIIREAKLGSMRISSENLSSKSFGRNQSRMHVNFDPLN